VPSDASRNVAPPGQVGPFWIFLTGTTVLGAALIGVSVATLSAADFVAMGAAFWIVAALLVLGELRPLITAGKSDPDGVTISTAFVFALLLHWGLAPALLMQAAGTLVADVANGKAWWRSAFNIAQYALSWGAAYGVLVLLHQSATPQHALSFTGSDLPATALAAAVYFVVNDGLVALAIALKERIPWREAVLDDFSYQVVTTGALLALSPLVVVAMERSVFLIPLLLLPLFAVYATASVSVEKEYQALHDALTGLPNRKLLLQHAREALEEARRTGEPLGLCLLDLDRFKEVNDTLGHHVGDQLLQLVGRRLEQALRPGDTVARLGGDEFAVLLPEVGDGARAVEVAGRMRAALTEPFRLEGMSFDLEASIGVAVHPMHADDFETLMQRADVAMYQAKETRTGIESYAADKDRNSTARLGMLGELRYALENDQLELHYQPKARLDTGEVVGVEALVRWRHPDRGMIQPDEFVPLAEQSGLMRLLTQWVVNAALAQAADWRERGLRVHIAVNISVRDLHDVAFVEYLRTRLSWYGVPARCLQLEITEGVLMSDPTRAAATLRGLAALGLELSLDDFGTGYSSLVHLKRLPVREIKIDRSFVQRMDVNEEDAAIVRSIIDLGGALGLRVVAEGVETVDAWNRLAELGCDLAQGYYLGRPVPAAELTARLAAARSVRSGPVRRPSLNVVSQ
jgi:diguanylate cyclase (GGDEF)-like protein